MFRVSVLMSSLKETCIYKNVTKVVWSLRTGCPASSNVDNMYEHQQALKPGQFTVSADSSATPVHPVVLFCPNFQPAQHLSVSPRLCQPETLSVAPRLRDPGENEGCPRPWLTSATAEGTFPGPKGKQNVSVRVKSVPVNHQFCSRVRASVCGAQEGGSSRPLCGPGGWGQTSPTAAGARPASFSSDASDKELH